MSSKSVLHVCRPQGNSALVGLPSAPSSEGLPRRAQMITIPAPAPASALTSAKWAQRRTAPKDPAAEVSHLAVCRCCYHYVCVIVIAVLGVSAVIYSMVIATVIIIDISC